MGENPLQTNARSTSFRERNHIFLQALALPFTDPTVRIEFVRVREDVGIEVHEVCCHAHRSLFA